MEPFKAVIWTRDYDGHYKTITRIVKYVHYVGGRTGPPKLQDPQPIRWADSLTWKEWTGKIKLFGRHVTVFGWTFHPATEYHPLGTDEPPLIWAYDQHGARSSDLAAWQWIHVTDHLDPDLSHYAHPHSLKQYARFRNTWVNTRHQRQTRPAL